MLCICSSLSAAVDASRLRIRLSPRVADAPETVAAFRAPTEVGGQGTPLLDSSLVEILS